MRVAVEREIIPLITFNSLRLDFCAGIRSAPHGIDLTLPIVRIAWDFDNPDATEIVIAPLVRDPLLNSLAIVGDQQYNWTGRWR